MSVHECQMSIHRSRHGERKTQQYERYSCATFVSAVLHSLVTFATNIKDYKYSLKMDHILFSAVIVFILFSAVIVFLSFLRSCFLFLDAIASLAPTHVSPTVSH